MNLEQQVVSLELAKRLKEMGVKQESLLWWSQPYPKEVDGKPNAWVMSGGDEPRVTFFKTPNSVSAFTVAELGEMLPQGISSYKNPDKKGEWRALAHRELWDREGVTLEGRPFTDADTEADARAKMLIYLIEHDLIQI